MKKEQGFTLIELLIVVAIIAVIAAIAVPNLLNARMAANETSAIASLRAISSAQIAYSTVSGGVYTDLEALVDTGQLDERFKSGGNISGYNFEEETGSAIDGVPSANASFVFLTGVYGWRAEPVNTGSTGRYNYGLGTDFVVRYGTLVPSVGNIAEGDPVGGKSGGAGS